jgi:L-threonylcarbamoyladenylate synthase
MHTDVIHINPARPEPSVISRAAEVLRNGGLVAFPTETVYGLGANALNEAAVAGIFAAKGRPAKNPVIVHVNDHRAAQELVAAWSDEAQVLAERFWPGPLSLVLPRQSHIPDVVTAGGPTVAIRIPRHPIARALIEASGVPLAAPSANRSNRISATTAEHVQRTLQGRVAMILDGGPTPGGLESTVLDLSGDSPRLLRPGLVTVLEIESALGKKVDVVHAASLSDDPLPSPGMLSRHYAPRVPLECIEGSGFARAQELSNSGSRVGWLALGEPPGDIPASVVACPMPHDVADYAARLFATLYALEDADVDRIIVDLPPSTPEWLAVLDRLRRASASA